MDDDDIIEQLGQDILAYVMSGSRAEKEIARRIKPEELDDRFLDYQLLLDLHFILRPDVVDFVKELRHRLRRIKTTTKVNTKTQRGTIEGHINWGSTIKRRYSQNPKDRSIFVCNNKAVNYDIPENIVLKHIVSIIHKTTQNAKEYLEQDYSWNNEAWKGEQDLIDKLERIVERNVHVDRIRSPDYYEPTEKMLVTAESSRQPLYQDAAELVRKRRAIQNGDPDEIEDLLKNTAITPDDEATLFELYVLFRFIAALEGLRDDRVTLETIETGKNEIARFGQDPKMVLYHNASAGDREVTFEAEESPKPPLSRNDRVQKAAQDISDDFFEGGAGSITGRPDVIVLEIKDEENNEYGYIIAEVKNSTRKATIKRGIRETLEYLAFLRADKSFVHENKDGEVFGTGSTGVLVVRDLDEDTQDVGDQSSGMKILQASEVKEELPDLLSENFGL